MSCTVPVSGRPFARDRLVRLEEWWTTRAPIEKTVLEPDVPGGLADLLEGLPGGVAVVGMNAARQEVERAGKRIGAAAQDPMAWARGSGGPSRSSTPSRRRRASCWDLSRRRWLARSSASVWLTSRKASLARIWKRSRCCKSAVSIGLVTKSVAPTSKARSIQGRSSRAVTIRIGTSSPPGSSRIALQVSNPPSRGMWTSRIEEVGHRPARRLESRRSVLRLLDGEAHLLQRLDDHRAASPDRRRPPALGGALPALGLQAFVAPS